MKFRELSENSNNPDLNHEKVLKGFTKQQVELLSTIPSISRVLLTHDKTKVNDLDKASRELMKALSTFRTSVQKILASM